LNCFELILKAPAGKGLLKGKTLGVDATDLGANTSLKSIVRKDNGDNWREYLRKLYEEETGNGNPDDEELRRFYKGRQPRKQYLSAALAFNLGRIMRRRSVSASQGTQRC
jgi:hypothetical protein